MIREALTRARLDVPEVHRILSTCADLLENYAETDPAGPERTDLVRKVARAADALESAAYGGPTPWSAVSYWIRPYDPKRDRRVWRWQRVPCLVLIVPEGPAS